MSSSQRLHGLFPPLYLNTLKITTLASTLTTAISLKSLSSLMPHLITLTPSGYLKCALLLASVVVLSVSLALILQYYHIDRSISVTCESTGTQLNYSQHFSPDGSLYVPNPYSRLDENSIAEEASLEGNPDIKAKDVIKIPRGKKKPPFQHIRNPNLPTLIPRSSSSVSPAPSHFGRRI